jgi:hypothetical protein
MTDITPADHRDDDPEDLAIVMNRIEILDYLNTDGERILMCSSLDADGNRSALIESLGALRLAEDTFIRQAMGEIPEEDDDEDQG